MAFGINWIEPVTDRRSGDVSSAKRYLESEKGKSGTLIDKKGCLNQSDLYRIESDQAFLARALGITIQSTQWVANDIPTASDETRIISNAQDIIDAAEDYFEDEPPELPETLVKYSDINKIEIALQFVYEALFVILTTDDDTPFITDGNEFLAVLRKIEVETE